MSGHRLEAPVMLVVGNGEDAPRGSVRVRDSLERTIAGACGCGSAHCPRVLSALERLVDVIRERDSASSSK